MSDNDRLSKSESLTSRIPIVFYRDVDSHSIIVTGSRRVAALKALAAGGAPGFAADMPVPAIEVTEPITKD